MIVNESNNVSSKKPCACGCGELVEIIDKWHHRPNYRNGHYFRGRKRPHQTGSNNIKWKGDNVGYTGLHRWIRYNLKEPESCEFCHRQRRLYAANITGIYNRDFKNWKYLCSSCHSKHDDILTKAWNTRRK